MLPVRRKIKLTESGTVIKVKDTYKDLSKANFNKFCVVFFGTSATGIYDIMFSNYCRNLLKEKELCAEKS